MNLQKNLLLALHLLLTSLAYSQSKPWPVKPKITPEPVKPKSQASIEGKNDIRMGLYFTRATLAYDRVLSNNWSVGAEGLLHGGIFTGYGVSFLGRFYLKSYNQSGFFLEEKITYAFYNPVVYDSIYIDSPDQWNAYGQHNANLNYFGNTFSGGYRVLTGQNFFVEFLAGLRAGQVKSGKTDKVMLMEPEATGSGTGVFIYANFFGGEGAPDTKSVFNSYGPGYPLYFNIRMGFIF